MNITSIEVRCVEWGWITFGSVHYKLPLRQFITCFIWFDNLMNNHWTCLCIVILKILWSIYGNQFLAFEDWIGFDSGESIKSLECGDLIKIVLLILESIYSIDCSLIIKDCNSYFQEVILYSIRIYASKSKLLNALRLF